MIRIKKDGKFYRVPNNLNPFQERLYRYLIDWKRENITEEPGCFNWRGQHILYDALLPDEYKKSLAILYPTIRDSFRKHVGKTGLTKHRFIGHMASSQAACFNLFLPLLDRPQLAAKVLRTILPDFKSLATNELFCGYQFEFDDKEERHLRDHSKVSGTDADVAIAYHDQDGNTNLWLIEHKLSEAEFTSCGGAKSKNRKSHHDCTNIAAIIRNPNKCYYHSERHFAYWELTLAPNSVFPRQCLLDSGKDCPFKGGTNQLWRNQLMARALETSKKTFSKAIFSVAYHPENTYLLDSIVKHQSLISDKAKFFTFTSDQVVTAAESTGDRSLRNWAKWYRELYCI